MRSVSQHLSFFSSYHTMIEADQFEAQALLWMHINGFTDSIVLKCALELGVFRRPMTQPELASSLPFPTVDSDQLYRVMRFLAHIKLITFAQDQPVTTCSLIPASKLLLRGEKSSLASFAMQQYYEMEAWHYLSAAVHGTAETQWEKCRGVDYRWHFAEDGQKGEPASVRCHDEPRERGNGGAGAGCKTGGMLEGLVDVDNSTGVAAGAIAAAFPGIRCAVFDLPMSSPPRRSGREWRGLLVIC